MKVFKGNGTISCSDIEPIYQKYGNEKIVIVIPNTKKQSEEKMKEIANKYPKVIFSVTGGLDPSKKKFNKLHYQERTYYTARELAQIIAIYRSIEKQIDISWNETQKAMFIYKELCNRMQYSENVVNGRDYSRGIGGLLYNKAVCSGFAMIFKEAMDRIGIECYYQNKECHHSWNIAKLDGAYRGIELTWDVTSKDENGCGFYYFNRSGADFYSSENHNLKDEKEENEFPITPYDDEELRKNYFIISQKRSMNIPMDTNKGKVTESPQISINNIPCVICKGNQGDISLKTLNSLQVLQSKNL